MIEIASQQIRELEQEQLRISQIPNVAKAILEKYAAVCKELQQLIEANEAWDKKKQLSDKAKSEAEQLNDLIVQHMAYIDQKLNAQMEAMNATLYDVEMKAPLVHVESSSKYSLHTPDDGGTGMRYKGLILFDLAVLQESNLPFVVHDSVLLLQIENEVLEKLLLLYSQQTQSRFLYLLTRYLHRKRKDCCTIHRCCI